MRKSVRRRWSRDKQHSHGVSGGERWPLMLLGAVVGGLGTVVAGRKLFSVGLRNALRLLLTEPYDGNLLELYSATARYGLQNLAETELRSHTGELLLRPLGSSKSFPNLTRLMFGPAQLESLPTMSDVPVDLKVTIGPKAQRPLQVSIPLLISGMAYGLALSEPAKLALARGASAVGTATNTGNGPWLESERQAASKLIYQYHRGNWSKSEQVLRQVDAIEIQFGQGALAGVGIQFEAELMDARLRQQLGTKPGEPAILLARHPEVQQAGDLQSLVDRLRRQSGGVPVGVKLAAGQRLEQDLQIALAAQVDFVAIDGAEAGTRGSPPITEDDFGLPTLFALVRASRYLSEQKARDRVSLIISGGLKTPGDVLKAIALGADAVYIGTSALYAITHTQVLRTVPGEPPTQLLWHQGTVADSFDIAKGSQSLERFLNATAAELAVGVRALGKCALHELCKADLFALDRDTADICGVRVGYLPQE